MEAIEKNTEVTKEAYECLPTPKLTKHKPPKKTNNISTNVKIKSAVG